MQCGDKCYFCSSTSTLDLYLMPKGNLKSYVDDTSQFCALSEQYKLRRTFGQHLEPRDHEYVIFGSVCFDAQQH
jgi:hypothetical protein